MDLDRHPLAHLRRNHHWSGDDLARLLRAQARRRGLRSGIDRNRIWLWETGGTTPSEESQSLLADVLDVPAAAIEQLRWPDWLPAFSRALVGEAHDLPGAGVDAEPGLTVTRHCPGRRARHPDKDNSRQTEHSVQGKPLAALRQPGRRIHLSLLVPLDLITLNPVMQGSKIAVNRQVRGRPVDVVSCGRGPERAIGSGGVPLEPRLDPMPARF